MELLDDVWKVENEFVETFAENVRHAEKILMHNIFSNHNFFLQQVNAILGRFTLAQIIGIIGGGGDGPIFGPEDPPADCKDVKQDIKAI